jgi:hypothetical protein
MGGYDPSVALQNSWTGISFCAIRVKTCARVRASKASSVAAFQLLLEVKGSMPLVTDNPNA